MRPDGFYWVKFGGYDEYSIAELSGNGKYWVLFNSDEPHTEADFDYISPEPIKTPEV